MQSFRSPYPARAVVGVQVRGILVTVSAIASLHGIPRRE